MNTKFVGALCVFVPALGAASHAQQAVPATPPVVFGDSDHAVYDPHSDTPRQTS